MIKILSQIKNKDNLNNKFKSIEELVIYYLLSCTIAIDFINGLWVTQFGKSHITFGQFIRGIIILVLVYIIYGKYKLDSENIILKISAFYIINIIVSYIYGGMNNASLKIDISYFLKVIYYIVFYVAITGLWNLNMLRETYLKKSIYNNLYYLPILIILSYFLGVGKGSYGDVGLKGVFLSLNAINVVMIVLFIFTIDQLFRAKNKIKWTLFTIYILTPMILLGSKSSVIFTIFVIALYTLLNSKNKKDTKTFLIIVSIMFMILTIVLFTLFYDYIVPIIYRQIHFIQERDIISYLLSKRNYLLEVEFNNFINDFSLRRVIIGAGFFNSHHELAIATRGKSIIRTLDMDLFDIFFAYGLCGVYFTYGYLIKIVNKNFRISLIEKSKPYVITILCLFIFSILGGHVLLETISSTFLAICLSEIYINLNSNDKAIT